MRGERLRRWARLSCREWERLRRAAGIVLVIVLFFFLFRPRFIVQGGFRSGQTPSETGKERFSVQLDLSLTIELSQWWAR